MISNGLLLKKRWNRISHLRDKIDLITVTTDSCTKLTYEKLRRGGKFEDLVENLEYINQLQLPLVFRMVVQQENYQEITPFYHWAKSFDATEIEYTRITNWGTYTDEEFLEKQIWNESHPMFNDFLIELKKIAYLYNTINNMNDIIQKYNLIPVYATPAYSFAICKCLKFIYLIP